MLIKREIIDASFEIVKRYKSSKNIEDIEMTFRLKDEDESEIKTVKEKVYNLKFINNFSFSTLFCDQKFRLINSRSLNDCEIIANLTDICNRLKNYKFDITKVYEYKFSKELENKYNRHLNKNEEYYVRVLKNYIGYESKNKIQKHINNVILNYYLTRRNPKKIRQEKLKIISKKIFSRNQKKVL